MFLLLATLLVAGARPVGGAAPPRNLIRLTFAEAVASAIGNHPEVLGARARLEAREVADRRMTDLTSDPEIQARPGYRFGQQDPNDGFDGTVTVQQRFNLDGLGEARRAAAEEERGAAGRRLAFLEREARAEAAKRWLQVFSLERSLTLYRVLVDDADALAKLAARALELGAGRRPELARARAFAAKSRLEAHDAEGRLFEAGLALSRALGAASGPILARGELPNFEALVDPEELVKGARASPEVEAAETEVRAALERARVADAAQGLEVVGGAGLGHEPPGDLVPSLSLGLTLPAFRRNQREVALARGEAASARVEVQRALRAARRMRIRALHEVEHVGETVRLLAEDLLPALEDAYEASKIAYELEAEPIRRVIEARIDLVEGQIRLVHAEAARVASLYALLLLAGGDGEP